MAEIKVAVLDFATLLRNSDAYLADSVPKICLTGNISEKQIVGVIDCITKRGKVTQVHITDARVKLGDINRLIKALGESITFLKVLDFKGTHLPQECIAGLVAVLNKSGLTSLGLENTGIDDELVKSLSKLLHENKNLKNLNLENNNITAESLPDLRALMKINKTLRVLQLNGNKIDWMSRENSKALSRITKALKKNNSRANASFPRSGSGSPGSGLVDLSLERSDSIGKSKSHKRESPIMGKLTSAPSPRKATLQYACSNKDVVSYMKSTLVFRVGANVRSLMLGNYLLTDEHVELLTAALSFSDVTIKSLNLTANSLTEKSAIYLTNLLAQPDFPLEVLRLSRNNIGNNGVVQLAKALETNTKLVLLDVSRNNITSDGAYSLASVLKLNQSLVTLNLSHNAIGANCAQQFVAVAESNPTLQYLNLDGNEAQNKQEDLSRILSRNQSKVTEPPPRKKIATVHSHVVERPTNTPSFKAESKYMQALQSMDNTRWSKDETDAIELALQKDIRKFKAACRADSITDAQSALESIADVIDQYGKRIATLGDRAPEFKYTAEFFRWIKHDFYRAQHRIIHLGYLVAVIGNLNAGKSCSINVLTGWELSPKRHTAMTMIPCRFVHNKSREVPILTIPFAPYLQQTLDKLRNCYKEQKQLAAQVGAKSADIAQMLRDIEDYQPGLLSQIENPETRILTSVEGEEATRSMLTLVNDMIRLAHLEPFIHLSLAKELREELAASIEGLPLVEVKFKNPILIPDDQGDELGTMTLIDTPGRNEADAKGSSSDPLISGFLNEVHDKVLGEVDALLVVVDARRVESQQEMGLFTPEAMAFGDRLHILANKLDTCQANDQELEKYADDDALCAAVYARVTRFTGSKLPTGPWRESNIYAASSRNYLLAKKLLLLAPNQASANYSIFQLDYQQLFEIEAPETIDDDTITRIKQELDRTRIEPFLRHMRDTIVARGPKWALSETCALMMFMTDKILENQNFLLENIENRFSLLRFLAETEEDVREQRRRELELIESETDVCNRAFRKQVAQVRDKVNALLTICNNPGALGHHLSGLQDIFGVAGSALLNYGELKDKKELRRSELKNSLQTALVGLQRSLLSTVAPSDGASVVADSIEIIRARHREYTEDVECNIRNAVGKDTISVVWDKSREAPLSTKAASVALTEVFSHYPIELSGAFSEDFSSSEQFIKSLLQAALHLLNQMERFVPEALRVLLTRENAQFYTPLINQITSSYYSIQNELGLRDGSIANAKNLLGCVQAALVDIQALFSPLIEARKPRLAANLSFLSVAVPTAGSSDTDEEVSPEAPV